MKVPTILGRAARGTWLALAILWLGGLTFYSAIVVPIGAQITSSTTQGFVTQRVTIWLNVLGTCYLAAVVRDAGPSSPRWRRCLWWALAAAQLALWWLHSALDRQLDPSTLSVDDAERFYAWHRAYLLTTAVQWLAGVAHVGRTERDSHQIAMTNDQ